MQQRLRASQQRFAETRELRQTERLALEMRLLNEATRRREAAIGMRDHSRFEVEQAALVASARLAQGPSAQHQANHARLNTTGTR